MNSFLPILIMLAVAILFAVFTIIASNFIGKKTFESGKLKAYECGVEPTGEPHVRFDIKFYLIAIFFLLFDIASLSLSFPEVSLFRKSGLQVSEDNRGHKHLPELFYLRPELCCKR